VEHSNSGILNDKRHEPDALSAQMQEWLTAAEARPSGPAPSSDAVRNPSDQYIGTAGDRLDFAPTRATSLDDSPRLRGVKNDQFTLKRPSAGKRMFRALARLFLAALLGIGATLGWQSHGEEAKQIVNAWAPSLSWVAAALPTNSPRERDASASPGQDSMQVPTLPRSAPVAQSASVAATSELMPRLEEMARDLAAVRRGLEEFAIKQEQMSQRMATLEAAEQYVRQKMSTSTPSQVVPVPQRKNAPNPAPPQAAQSSPLPTVPVSGQAAPARPPIPVR
jgi:hypothetical protein